jgi:Flp pilus assembly protein protease CpaA
MYKPFFPNEIFGWSFFCLLMLLLCIAARIDFRTARIPKKVSIIIALTGVLANVVRGGYLALAGCELWLLDSGSVWVGLIDGFLFAVAGLLFAFIVYFGMFVLNCCGGGDVKLGAAIGAWIGAYYTIFLLFATVAALVIWITGKILAGGLPSAKKMRERAKRERQSPYKRVTFAFSATLATAAVMLWFFRYDLQIASPPAQEAQHGLAETAIFG